jgi:hypothetical protein
MADNKITLSPHWLIDEREKVDAAFRRAVNHALMMNKRLGNPIATWKDGKVVIVPPEEIVLSSEVSDAESSDVALPTEHK